MPDYPRIERRVLGVVLQRLAEDPVVLLQGPRTVGKTYLLNDLTARCEAEIIDLDDPLTRDAMRADPTTFVQGSSPVLIDEYQHERSVLAAIKASAEPDDDLDHVGTVRRTAALALLSRPSPLASRRLSVPTQQGFWCDQKRPPPAPGQDSAQCSKESPIGRPVSETSMELTFGDLHLTAEHQDIDDLVSPGNPGQFTMHKSQPGADASMVASQSAVAAPRMGNYRHQPAAWRGRPR